MVITWGNIDKIKLKIKLIDAMKKVLIAIDNSPAGEKIATNGLQLALELKAEIALLSVIDTNFLITDGGVSPKEIVEETRTNFKNVHQMLIDRVFKETKVWTFIEEGKPHEIILKVADEWNADIIVLGTHGRTGLTHLLMGSVAEKVVRHAAKPIVVIPNKIK